MTEIASALPAEVTSTLSSNTIVTLAIVSAICSAVALILNAIIPLITQCLSNKHALKMAKIEQWEKAKFEAFQQLVSGAEILASLENIPSLAITNACIGIAKIMPYLDRNELNKSNRLINEIKLLKKYPDGFSNVTQDYIALLNTIAAQFEEPNLNPISSKIKKLIKTTKEKCSSIRHRQK